MDDRIIAAIKALRTAADTLNEALVGYAPAHASDAVRDLHEARMARKTVQACESEMERATAALLTRDPLEVEGVGVALARRGSARKAWDHGGLIAAVLDHHLTALAGELPTPWQVRDWLMDAAAVSYWRVGVLRDLGIDPGEYCETTPGRPTVQITTTDAIGGAA